MNLLQINLKHSYPRKIIDNELTDSKCLQKTWVDYHE